MTAEFLFFLLLLLVVSLPVYWIVCRSVKARLLFLLGINLAAISVLHLPGMILCLGVSLTVFFLTRVYPKKWAWWISFVLPLTVLVFFKYLGPVLSHFSLSLQIIVPLGVSYYIFKLMHFVIERRRGNIQKPSLTVFLNYIFFFPMFIAGPIERFPAFQNQITDLHFSKQRFSRGLERIVIGLFKKIVLADVILKALLLSDQQIISGIDIRWHAWLCASFVKFLYTYMDFSGYIDMAIGIGLLYGIKLMENFNRPLLQSNLADFWRRWHISLSGWARDYVYYPMMLKTRSVNLPLLLTMMTIGVWHGPQASWALWGIHHGIGLIVYNKIKRLIRKHGFKWPTKYSWAIKALGILTVWFYLSLGHSLHLASSGSIITPLKIYLKILTFGLL